MSGKCKITRNSSSRRSWRSVVVCDEAVKRSVVVVVVTLII